MQLELKLRDDLEDTTRSKQPDENGIAVTEAWITVFRPFRLTHAIAASEISRPKTVRAVGGRKMAHVESCATSGIEQAYPRCLQIAGQDGFGDPAHGNEPPVGGLKLMQLVEVFRSHEASLRPSAESNPRKSAVYQ